MYVAQQMKRLNTVVPCYNPSLNWSKNLVLKYEEFKAELPYVEHKMILVIDGAGKNIEQDDLSYLKKRIPLIQVIHYQKNRGKGFALRAGVKEASEGAIIFTDIDFPYKVKSMVKVAMAVENADVAIGTRSQAYYEHVPFLRTVVSKVLRWILKNVLRLIITDTQCGLKGFNQKGRAVFLKTEIDRFLFDLEFVMRLSRTDDIILIPVDVQLNDGVKFSKTRLGILFSELLNFFHIILKK